MNITNEQLNKTLSDFFGDKETAQKFADAMRKGLDSDFDPLKELNAEVDRVLESHGFAKWAQGGGFYAWGKNLGNAERSPYVLVSFGEDVALYFDQVTDQYESLVCVGFYNADGEPVSESAHSYHTWADFKREFGGASITHAEAESAMIEELERWAAWQGLELSSCDEMLEKLALNDYQRDYLTNYEMRWDSLPSEEV